MIRFLLMSLVSLVFEVFNQADFDTLPSRLVDVLVTKDSYTYDTIEIHFSPGVYLYREGHLSVSGQDRPNTRFIIKGEGCVFVANDGETGLACNYVNLEALKPVDVWGPVREAQSWPIPVGKGVYKIRCDEPDLPEDEAGKTWLHISQWYQGPFYPVVKIQRGWLYFRKDVDGGTSLWSELRFGRCLPRYILCDYRSLPEGLHACSSTNFLTISQCRFDQVSMEGLCFLGNKDGGSLLFFEQVQAGSITVSDCLFSHIRSMGIRVTGTDRFRMENCRFTGNYQCCVDVQEGCRDAVISGNCFIGNGRMMTNRPLVHCSGVDYAVRDNYFEDFSYSAIGLGIHFTEVDIHGTSGVVERNEICQSEAFRGGVFRSLVDSGAIYITTNNAHTVIRDNYIHDIDGPHGNRGILADDGVINVTIENNTILRIRNGYCIDLRRCLRVAWLPDSKVQAPNTGNRIVGNVYDGDVKLYIRKNDATSFIGNNKRICE